MIYHTCVRCGLTDANVLDLDTGGAYHPELRGCISMLRDRLATVEAERDALQADILARSGFRTLWEIDHACVNNERDVALRILAKLREPSEKVLLAAVEAVPYGASYAALTRCIPAAVAAAEREATNDEG